MDRYDKEQKENRTADSQEELKAVKMRWARYFVGYRPGYHIQVQLASAEAAVLDSIIDLYQTEPVSEPQLYINTDLKSYLKYRYLAGSRAGSRAPVNSSDSVGRHSHAHNDTVPLSGCQVADGQVWFGGHDSTTTYTYKDGLANGPYWYRSSRTRGYGQCHHGRKVGKQYIYDSQTGYILEMIDYDLQYLVSYESSQINVIFGVDSPNNQHCYYILTKQMNQPQDLMVEHARSFGMDIHRIISKNSKYSLLFASTRITKTTANCNCSISNSCWPRSISTLATFD